MGHHHVCQTLSRGQLVAGLGQLCAQIGGGDGHTRIGVGDVVFELLGTVHGIDRHHHRIGPQNRKMGHHQLWAVLHVEHHPIPFFHPQVLQVGRQLFGLVHQLPVTHAPT